MKYNKANNGMSPSGKAADSDSAIRWFESSHPSQISEVALNSDFFFYAKSF